MKGISFLIKLAVTVLACSALVFGIWRYNQYKSYRNVTSEALEIPIAAKFLPKDAPLTVHLKTDLVNFPKYIEAVSPRREKSNAKKEATKIRNGLFRIAGLNFENDLSKWIEPRLSFSIIRSYG